MCFSSPFGKPMGKTPEKSLHPEHDGFKKNATNPKMLQNFTNQNSLYVVYFFLFTKDFKLRSGYKKNLKKMAKKTR